MADPDPIRIALLASQASHAVAAALPNEGKVYQTNAVEFETWACEVMDKCQSQTDARIALMRRSPVWPGTVLRVAIDGENKKFVGNHFVQALVDEWWRGNSLGNAWALPVETTTFQIIAHLIWPFGALSMEPVRFGAANLMRRQHTIKDYPAMGTMRDLLAHTDFGELPERTAPEVVSRRRGSLMATTFKVREAGREMHLRYQSQEMLGFLAAPRTKFTLRVISYTCFLALYVLALNQNGGKPHLGFTLVDVLFYGWAVALWLEELSQWAGAARRGERHLDDMWNVIDVFSLSLLLVVLGLRITASMTCAHVGENVAVDAAYSVGGRALHGGGGGHHDDDQQLPMQWDMYKDCKLLQVARVPLSLNAVACFLRVLNWLTVWERIGVISVILLELYNDIKIFVVILAL
eukprot:6661217-Prymnesium_polylepis.1